MRRFIISIVFGVLLLVGGGTAANAQVSFGITIGRPPAARVEHRPPRPGAESVWVNGYWYPVDGRYVWHEGYWSRPPYGGAHWVNPRYSNRQFYNGYWDGDRGRIEHNHDWDRDRDRDFDRDRDRH
jgi:hypothetical protein